MRKLLISLFLLITIGHATAIAPIVVGVIIGASVVGGGVIGYWLGTQKTNEYEKLLQEYQQRLTLNTIQNDINTRLFLQELYTRDKVMSDLAQDLSEYSKNYAWALAKYTALKALFNGSSCSEAQELARQAVYNYYLNLTRTIITMNNETIELLEYVIDYYADNIQVSKIVIDYPDKYKTKYIYFDNVSCSWKVAGNYEYVGGWNRYVKTVGVNVLGQSFSIKEFWVHVDVKPSPYEGAKEFDEKVTKITIAGEEVYNPNIYYNALNQIDSAYDYMVANIDAYVSQIASNMANLGINETDLLDPYILATFLNTDLNTTGYYGYAGAELALLGLPITGGLNTTMTIDVNGTILDGYLFTDWDTIYEVGQNYTVPSGSLVYFLDDNGTLYKLPEGTMFTILGIRDWKGNEIPNTTIYYYVDHSGDIQQLYEEMARLRKLYEDYLNMSTTINGGGDGSSLMDWWNSLDDYAKIGLIAGGCILLYALTRRK